MKNKTAVSTEFINRELSWLEFNQRVLDEGRDPSVPLLERLNFLAITASNLDEFFMVRIGGLQTAIRRDRTIVDPAGMAPAEQLTTAAARVDSMMADLYECFLNELDPQLSAIGIRRRHSTELSEIQTAYVERVFEEQISSILTPLAVYDPTDFPLLQGRTVNVAVQLEPEEGNVDFRFAVIPFGKSDLRFITLPSDGGFEFILGEDLAELFIQRFFPGEKVISSAPFRITRNADLSVREDDGSDLLVEMQDILDERKDSFCVRLELSDQVTTSLQDFLKSLLAIDDSDIYVVSGPVGFSDFMRLADLNGFADYRYPRWTPRESLHIEPETSIFDVIRDQDILLVHPYESFDPVVRMVSEAADDPDVLAIKQTLYRTSRNSPIVEGLMRAAENGKNVTVIVELKARFDEARNIKWAKQMEYAGVQVIYGVRGLKTHGKACIVVRREPHGYIRYVHFGTGNYNEITAGLYTDLSYITCDEGLGSDAVSWFNAVTGYSQLQELRYLVSAPVGLREKFLELISLETERARQGSKARIVAKCNSLADPKIIRALYEASQAGVEVQLNIRGICCLRPQVPGLSDHIHVTSIIDRFLEHSRIYYFYHGGDQLVFMSSADLMPRNLDKRVELLIPVLDSACKQRVIETVELCLKDNVKARRILQNGSYDSFPTTSQPVRSQAESQRQATDADEIAVKRKQMMFTPQEPH